MRYVLSLLALAGLGACAHRSATVQTAATPAQTAPRPAFQKPRTVSTIPIHTFPGDTALVYERTPCYGTCPSYTATIFRSGKVSYHGDRFVPLTGDHTLSLDPATVQAMLDEARRLEFTSLSHQYLSNVSDLPSTIVTVYLPGQHAYRVLAESAIPTGLQGYLDYLRGKLDPLAGLKAER